MEADLDWDNYLNQGWDQAVVLEEVKRLNLRLQVRGIVLLSCDCSWLAVFTVWALS
jgi:hypothetical protein